MEKLYEAEYRKTFTVEGGIRRYQILCQMFVEDSCMEMSLIVDTVAQVLHNKYGLGWDEIEELAINAYKAA